MIRLWPALMVLALAGCGTSPVTRYHTLQSTQAPATGGGAERLVEVLPVLVPASVDRNELVLTDAAGRLAVQQGERWSGDLAEQLRGVLADALWREARATDVYAAPVPAGASNLPQYRLAVRFERLDARPQGATVAASWTLRRLPDGRALTCRSAEQRGMASFTPDAASEALGAAAAAVATTIAAEVARFDRGGACPTP
jgi:uncharacterized protein